MAIQVPEEVLEEFQLAGSWLDRRGLNTSHSGNLSRRIGDNIYITRSGAMLGYLTAEDIVAIPSQKEDMAELKPSMETPVHLSIYRKTKHNAVVHAHPPFTVALSLRRRGSITPMDVEGRAVVGEVKVLHLRRPAGSEETAESVAEALRKSGIVVVASHGVFAGADDMKDALHLISSLEFSSMLLMLHSMESR